MRLAGDYPQQAGYGRAAQPSITIRKHIALVSISVTRLLMVEQTTAVDPQFLGRSAGRLEVSDLLAVDEALALILGL